MSDRGRLFNLTLLPETAKARNYSPRILITYEASDHSVMEAISTLTIPVHNITHVDLPTLTSPSRFPYAQKPPNWISNELKDAWELVRRRYDSIQKHLFDESDSENNLFFEKYYDSLNENSSHECIIVDLSERQNKLLEYLSERKLLYTSSQPNTNHLFLHKKIGISNFVEIFRDHLFIGPEIIRDISKSCNGLKDKFILFKTGWNKFLPEHDDWNHPVWFCWHLFLLYPFIDSSTSWEILKSGCIGVGTDAVSIECPLYYTQPDYRVGDLKKIVDELRSGKKPEWIARPGKTDLVLPFPEKRLTNGKGSNGEQFVPAHAMLLFGEDEDHGQTPFRIISNLDLKSLTPNKIRFRQTDLNEALIHDECELFIFPLKLSTKRSAGIGDYRWTGMPVLAYAVV